MSFILVKLRNELTDNLDYLGTFYSSDMIMSLLHTIWSSIGWTKCA